MTRGIEVLETGGRRRSKVRRMLWPLLLLLCGAATYQSVLSAFDWRASHAAARAILASPQSTDDEWRNALYIVLRHHAEDAKILKGVIDTASGARLEHAKNGLQFAREQWR